MTGDTHQVSIEIFSCMQILNKNCGWEVSYVLPFWQSYTMTLYFSFKGLTAISAFPFDNLPLVVCAESTLAFFPGSFYTVFGGANSLSGRTQCLAYSWKGVDICLYILPSCVSHRYLHLRGSCIGMMKFCFGLQYICSYQSLEHSVDIMH